jgi:hypothetical protein
MAVGITILSGARQAQEVGLDQPEFRAGDDPACEVYFDPRLDPGASGGRAQFQLGSDGWYVKNIGEGPLLINGVRAEGRVRLRSADVVRLMPAGPEFSFKLLATLPPGRSPFAPRKDVLSQGERRPSAMPLAQPAVGVDRSVQQTLAEPRSNWAMPAAIALGTLVGLLILYLTTRPPTESPNAEAVAGVQRAAQNPAQAKDEPPPAVSEVDRPRGNNASPSAKADETQSVVQEEPAKSDAGEPNPPIAGESNEAADDAVFLVLVEEPKSAAAWPFGTAAAITDHTLLTSATVAIGLADFRNKGWKLWAMNQRLGLKSAVNDLRVHAGFVGAQGTPEKQVYADVGLVTVADSLPKQLSLATADELAELDRGLPVTLLGYLYENEPIDRFQSFLPDPHAGKIFIITSLPPSPGGPRLMHVRAELSGKMYGAPILNSAGHLLGVFAETALPEPGAADLHVHYAPVAVAAPIDRWIKDHDEQWWVAPIASK